MLRESRGSAACSGAGLAAHAGPVAGDRLEDSAPGEEDEQQGPQTTDNQPNSINDIIFCILKMAVLEGNFLFCFEAYLLK